MSEHVHEWRYNPTLETTDIFSTPGFFRTIKSCRETMRLPEAERRLNATEMLDGKSARNLLTIPLEFVQEILEAYAFALEELDGK